MTLALWLPLHDDQAADLSGNGNHATLTGGYTTGVAGRGGLDSTQFNGSDGYASVSGFPHDVAGFSAFAWVNIQTAPGTGEYAVRQRVDGDNNWALTYRPDGEGDPQPIVSQSNRSETLDVKSLPGEWHHFGFASDAGRNAVAYWDGEPMSAFAMESSSGTADLAVGGNYGGSRSLHALVCDVRVYRRAVLPGEARALYEQGSVDVATPPTDGVSRYPLNGDATDAWGNNDGTTSGGVSWSSEAVRGKSALLDGADDYIDTNIADSAPFSWSAWVVYDGSGASSSGENPVVSTRDNDAGAGLRERGSGQWEFYLYDSEVGSFTTISTSKAPTGVLTHLVVVFDGLEARLYYNGTLEDTTSVGAYVTGNPIRIGARADGGHFYPGLIDDVRLYDYALSPEDVYENYRWGTRGRDLRETMVTA